MRSPGPRTTRTAEPGASRPASRVAAACAEVTTSAGWAGTPHPASWAAVAAGGRAGEVGADRGGGARVLVAHVAQPHPGVGRLGQRLRGPGHGRAAQVDDPVQV